jgi:hypothetical protein
MVKVIARIVPLMSDPAIIFRVNVRRFRMAFSIAKAAMFSLTWRLVVGC